eukprot:827013-Pelagomonas_calceolata.AAC.4
MHACLHGPQPPQDARPVKDEHSYFPAACTYDKQAIPATSLTIEAADSARAGKRACTSTHTYARAHACLLAQMQDAEAAEVLQLMQSMDPEHAAVGPKPGASSREGTTPSSNSNKGVHSNAGGSAVLRAASVQLDVPLAATPSPVTRCRKEPSVVVPSAAELCHHKRPQNGRLHAGIDVFFSPPPGPCTQ